MKLNMKTRIKIFRFFPSIPSHQCYHIPKSLPFLFLPLDGRGRKRKGPSRLHRRYKGIQFGFCESTCFLGFSWVSIFSRWVSFKMIGCQRSVKTWKLVVTSLTPLPVCHPKLALENPRLSIRPPVAVAVLLGSIACLGKNRGKE
jgi:hypothetical protein